MVGLLIKGINPQSPLRAMGLEEGDRIVSINGLVLEDIIDYYFSLDSPTLEMRVLKKGGGELILQVRRQEGVQLGLDFSLSEIRRCNNRCIFCFIDQLPGGMRSTLYLRDDDYRLSFLYGNYITLTNLREEDFLRIERQRLSPLYVSVHSTDPQIRNFMLGNPRAPDILPQLTRLSEAGISFHAQIVLCPGINDGASLEKTLQDLAHLYPAASSVAVIPVGLTRFRRSPSCLRPVEAGYSRDLISWVRPWQRRFRRWLGKTFLYLADEFYLLAGEPFPSLSHYDELAQLENGVGLVPKFIKDFKSLRYKLPERINKKERVAVITGEAPAHILRQLLAYLAGRYGLRVQVWPIKNRFFGSQITVTGLLTGSDLLADMQELNQKGFEEIIIPSVMLTEDGEKFLDDVSLSSIQQETPARIRVTDPSARGLVKALLG